MSSAQIECNGWTVWCDILGTGPKPLLLIPGSIGTGQTDFYHQLYGEHSLDLEEFTVVCIEIAGWGRSRPPARLHSREVYKNDAECCVKLMRSLGYNKFSVLGWSAGARVALVLASLYPDQVHKVILLGILSFQTEIDTKNIIELTKDVKQWNQRTIDNYLRVYKELDQIQQLWSEHMIFIGNFTKYFPDGIIDNKFETISCPLLIIHGDEDPMIPLEHALYVLERVNKAQIKRFPNGSHNLHHKYRAEFKKIVEEFLLQSNNQ